MNERQLNSTTHPITWTMVLSSDKSTSATGLSPTVKISKDGGSYATPAATPVEIGNGDYALPANATDRNTLGPLLLYITASGAEPVNAAYEIVGYDPYDSQRLGLSALPASSTLAVKPSVALAAADVSGNLPANLLQVAGATASNSGSTVTFPASIASASGVNVTQLAGSTVAVSGGTTTFPATVSSFASGGDVNVINWRGSQPNVLQGGRVDGYVGAYATGQAPLQPTTAGNKLDVNATGEAGIDWANVGGQATAVNLSNTTIKTISGNLEGDILGDLNSTVNANLQTIMNQPVAVTGVGTVTFQVGQTIATTTNITQASGVTITGDPLTVATRLLTTLELISGSNYRFTTAALANAPTGGGGGSTDWTADERTAIRTILGIPITGTTPTVPTAGALKVIDDYIDSEVAAIKAKTDLLPASPAATGDIPTAGQIADTVLDELLSGHTIPGSVGKALTDAQASGNPLESDVPGSYAAGSAGAALGRIAQVPGTGPIAIIPEPNIDENTCVVYGTAVNTSGQKAKGVEVKFINQTSGIVVTAGGLLLNERTVSVLSGPDGAIRAPLLDTYVYKIYAPGLLIDGIEFTAVGPQMDLADIAG